MANPPYHTRSNSTYPPFFCHPPGMSDQLDSPPTIGIQVTECEVLPPLDNGDASPGSGPGSFPPTPPNIPNSFGARNSRLLQISTSPLSLEVPSKHYCHTAPTSPTEPLLDDGFLVSQDPPKDIAVGRRRAHSHSGYQLGAAHNLFTSSPSAPPHSAFACPQYQDRNWRSDGSPYSDTTSLHSPYIDDTHDFDHSLPDSNGSPLLSAEGGLFSYQHPPSQSTDFLSGHSTGSPSLPVDHASFYQQSSNNHSLDILDSLNEIFPYDLFSSGSGFPGHLSWDGQDSLLLDTSPQPEVLTSTPEPPVNSTSMARTESFGLHHAGVVYSSSPDHPQASSPSLQHSLFPGSGSNNQYAQYPPSSLDVSQLGDSSSNHPLRLPTPASVAVGNLRTHIRGPRPKPANRRLPDEEVIARKQLVYDAMVQSINMEEARARVEELVEKHREVAYLDDFVQAISHHPKESDIGRERAKDRRRREPTFKCILCGDLMTTNNNLQNHYRSHLSLSVYKCTFCNRRFMTDSIYQRHLKTTAKCPGSAKYAASKARKSPVDDFSQGSSASGSLAQIP